MKVSTLDFMLLGLLLGGPRSGYDLRKWISETPLVAYSDSPGAIYPALRRLSSRGWIRSQNPSGGRRRQAVELTDEGKTAFSEWLHQPVERQDVINRGEELLLRFAFMGPMRLHDLARRFLEQYERENIAYLAALRQYYAEHGEMLPLTGRMTFEHGLEQFQARVEWAQRAFRALKDEQ
jgi:DNA-binding PadR family transcriptional regulator